jgi:hypothetical protein
MCGLSVAIFKSQAASDGIAMMLAYYRCGPIPFFCLLVATVWGTILMNGGTWVAATLAGFLTCSLSMLGATAWRICMSGWRDMRVYVNNDLIDEVDQGTPPVRGTVLVAGAGLHVVVGIPVDLNIQNTFETNVQPAVVGRPMVWHDQHLRAAGVA